VHRQRHPLELGLIGLAADRACNAAHAAEDNCDYAQPP
jgi:hypothetical protein